jgi:hypothetical protein
MKDFNIRELNLELIQPSTENMNNVSQGGSKTVVIGKPGCFEAGTKVLMFDGYIKKIEDITVEDQVMGDDSTPRNVLELCRGTEQMYEIVPENGDSVTVNYNHILSLKNPDTGIITSLTVKELLNKHVPDENDQYNGWFKTHVTFPKQYQKIDPYILGFWLSSSADGDIKQNWYDTMENFLSDQNSTMIHLHNDRFNFSIRYIDLDEETQHLLQNKRIPYIYKINSIDNRLKLLSGIIDATGYYIEDTFRVTFLSDKLVDDVIFVARSLGFVAHKIGITKRYLAATRTVYTCVISGDIHNIPQHLVKITIPELNNIQIDDSSLIFKFKIKPKKIDQYYGFVLDGNHRFLLKDFSVVHNTGKTTLISSLLYAKKHIFPVGMVMSGSEDSNNFYKTIFPSTFVFNDYNDDKIKDFIRRQKIARQHLENPWAVCLLDDCTDDPKIFNKPLQHAMYKKGRHWKMWYILSLQYCMDVKPVIRINVDGCFILREPSPKIRRAIWENYAGIIPSFSLFCDLMDGITDSYTALYIHNATQSNEVEDCVYYYKAKPPPQDFKFGCPEFWEFHYARYNPEYVEPFL